MALNPLDLVSGLAWLRPTSRAHPRYRSWSPQSNWRSCWEILISSGACSLCSINPPPFIIRNLLDKSHLLLAKVVCQGCFMLEERNSEVYRSSFGGLINPNLSLVSSFSPFSPFPPFSPFFSILTYRVWYFDILSPSNKKKRGREMLIVLYI